MELLTDPAVDRAVLDGAAREAVPHEAELAVLDEQVGVLAAQLHALSAQLVDLVAGFDALGGSHGFCSTSQWLSVRGGFSPGEARRLCSLARRRDELPALMAHGREGRRSPGVLAMAARVATPDNQDQVADIVASCTPAQAARVLAKYRTITPPPDPDEPPATRPAPEPATWWRMWHDDHGRGRIDAALSPQVAALVHQAWDAARAAGETEHDLPPHERLGADEVASRWATTMLEHAHDQRLTRPGGDRHHVMVDIDVATLARVLGLDHDPHLPIGLGTHAFDARTGAHLADHDLATILCDTDLQVLVHHHGVPLWMSNTTRTATRHQRRALRFRSGGTGGCEYPGCTQTRYLDAHHVRFHRDHGPTTPSNMVLLCGHHHRALHRGWFTITTTGDQRFTFTDHHGDHLGTTTTADHPGGPPPHQPPPHQPPLPHTHPPPPQLHPDTPRAATGGERLTPYALDAYLSHLLSA